MDVILALFTKYLQPITIGLTSILGMFFISRAETFKAENQELNNSIEDANKTIEAQNEALQAIVNAPALDLNGITDRMREGKL